jgi:hypothetical protein
MQKSVHVASLIAIVPDGSLALDRTISNVHHDEPDSSSILCDKAEPVTVIDSIQDLRIMRLRPATACGLCRQSA